MKHIYNYELFLEDINNPNTPQGYLNSLSKKPKLKPQQKQQPQTPTEEVDAILQDTEEQKAKIIARKDAIEKGLLNNINQLEPENQRDVKVQVNDYRNQVKEFDKTVKQIGNLNKTLKKSDTSETREKIEQRLAYEFRRNYLIFDVYNSESLFKPTEKRFMETVIQNVVTNNIKRNFSGAYDILKRVSISHADIFIKWFDDMKTYHSNTV